jgi:hypothetical protein
MSEKLMCTNNYTLFENDQTNRDVGNTAKLIKSMQKYGNIAAYPIHVVKRGDKLHVKDGGHRLAAAKHLGLCVYYVVCKDDEVCIAEINNAGRGWSLADYVSSFVRAGNEEYIKLQEFHEETGLPLGTSARVLYGEQAQSGSADKVVKAGTFKVKAEAYAWRIASIIKALDPLTPVARNTIFMNAISRCCLVKGFSADQFLRNALKAPYKLTLQASLEGYMDMCEMVYNHHLHGENKIPLKFLANEASANRMASKGFRGIEAKKAALARGF